MAKNTLFKLQNALQRKSLTSAHPCSAEESTCAFQHLIPFLTSVLLLEAERLFRIAKSACGQLESTICTSIVFYDYDWHPNTNEPRLEDVVIIAITLCVVNGDRSTSVLNRPNVPEFPCSKPCACVSSRRAILSSMNKRFPYVCRKWWFLWVHFSGMSFPSWWVPIIHPCKTFHLGWLTLWISPAHSTRTMKNRRCNARTQPLRH
jgi:hypothetical protein